MPHAAQHQLGQRKDEEPNQQKDYLSQTKGTPGARRCRCAPNHSRDKLTGETPKKSLADVPLSLCDFHERHDRPCLGQNDMTFVTLRKSPSGKLVLWKGVDRLRSAQAPRGRLGKRLAGAWGLAP
jgi:hypothetical protein